jgi:cobalt-zinc-cadmium efflux system membrane fusion protein
VRLGDEVQASDTLAVVHGNESLTDFAILASQSGTVIARDVAVGEVVTNETVLFTIADFSSVWVDFAIYPQNADRVRRGQTAIIRSTSRDERSATGSISYVGPLLEQDTRVSYGRIVLPNPQGDWRPGLFVNVRVRVDRASAKIAVPESAIVRSEFGPAVFRAVNDEFELQPVVVGRSDGEFVEIVSGLEPGAAIVVTETFLLKAELGKSEAHHDH